MQAFQLPSSLQLENIPEAVDDDDDDRTEEEQMLMIMNQIQAHHKKTEKRKQQKDIEALSKDIMAKFKKAASHDVSILKKRRNESFKTADEELDRLKQENEDADSAFDPVNEQYLNQFEQLKLSADKSIERLKALKNIASSLESELEEQSGPERIIQFAHESTEQMTKKMIHIEETKSSKKNDILMKMMAMMGSS